MTRRTQYPVQASDAAAAVPLIDVVIVTARGSWELLNECLRSLRDNPPQAGPISVHVVDNASRDGTVDSVRRLYQEVTIEELADNRGFAHACNVAIRRTRGPFVLLLNPDTVIYPEALDRLLEALNRYPRAGIAGPRLIGTDGVADHNAKRSFPTPAAALAHFIGVCSPPGSAAGAGYGRTDIDEFGAGAVDAVSGSCMLVRRSAIAQVGLMDEGYWMYGEDLDWCRRFGQSGWQVRYEGSATILHVKHGVTGRHRTLRTNWAFHRSMGRFYRRFDAGRNLWLDGAVYAGVLAKFALSVSRSRMMRRPSAIMRANVASAPSMPTRSQRHC
ncbi:MAG: glycosyltransferase family 2 protein [Solirubrobacteraceae bacterium]